MFKARDRETDREIIILDACWNNETLPALREKGRRNLLLCPICRQPVRVKAGEKKRRHFAHQDLSHCPLGHESPAILEARSLLYRWLDAKYPGQVTVEKAFAEYELPRLLDCYVEPGNQRKFGYWILESGLRSREPFTLGAHILDISLNWLFLSTMLRFTSDREAQLLNLTPTEREFAYASEYNLIYSSYDRALNYLNAGEQTLITFRGLHCIHSPQEYAFQVRLDDRLEQMLISRKTGEFVYRGEFEKLQAYRERQRKIAEEARKQREKEEQRRRQFAAWQKRLGEQPIQPGDAPGVWPPARGPEPGTQESLDYLHARYRCKVCGKVTHDWIELELSSQTCICSRECLRKLQKTD